MKSKIVGPIVSATVSFSIMLIACGQVEPKSRPAAGQESYGAVQNPQLFFGGEAPSYVGGPFEVLGESASHPDSAEVYVGRLADGNGQHGIKTHTANVYGSVVKDYTLNLQTGFINVAVENPFIDTTIMPPKSGGNYFEYVTALNEMLSTIRKVRGGSNVVPHTTAPKPELDDAIRYVEFIISQLAASSLEAVYITNPNEVRPSGSYNVDVSYKSLEPRELYVDFLCEDTVLGSGKAVTSSGIGKVLVHVDIPGDISSQCSQPRFEVKLVAINPSPRMVAKFNHSVDVAVSNVIERVYTRAATSLRDQACWFSVGYASTQESILTATLVRKENPGVALATLRYVLPAGDKRAQEVLMMLPEDVRKNFNGTEKIIVTMWSKDGKRLAEYSLYAANARA